MDKANLKKLRGRFLASEIEWRVQRCGEKNGKFWAVVIPYVQNRAIMDRLDDIVGPENWKNRYFPGPSGGLVCGLAIRIDGEWVEKYDGAANTDLTEGGKADTDSNVKGGLSASMKRAAVQWGIGRYLYDVPQCFAKISEQGMYRAQTKEKKDFKWDPPTIEGDTKPVDVKTQPAPQAPEQGGLADLKSTVIEFIQAGQVFMPEWVQYANDACTNNDITALKACIGEAAEVLKSKEGGKF